MNDETIEVRPGEQLDWVKVEQYLHAHIPGIGTGTWEVRQFPSGASNLTYLVRIGEWEGVLRRPPFGPVPPKAHDMQRESSLLEHIHPFFPLAPRPYLFCNNLEIIGVPFYIMERRKGIVLNDTFPRGTEVTPELCWRISETVVDTLVEIHAIDWQAAGLAAFGHPVGFLERQVRGWIERYNRSQTNESPDVTALTRWLVEHIPTSPAPTLIHNDFKLNNMLLDTQDLARPVAVLDWEMSTVGDPLFDLAVTLSYWIQPDDSEELRAILPTITYLPGFMNRTEFMKRYAQRSGLDLSSMHFYLTFAYFKLSVIVQQIYIRWLRGQTHDQRFAIFGSRVRTLIDHAMQLISQGAI
ncbi:aminoglycoside phosphotransferase [Reticulibacter mediterranei]|uniref:Aminoglycoside phosphotransferase n=1 Tax=Reticulibacter mediterranei TaxID=2778369 RepID=A0A8J3IMF1_9CHLR|nr:phosphotransferase family protein [Reticulibacter mediterranei]GHO95053.1 aminoglycoside phosphotransferase [Reticulibacter mediterranei]